MNKYYDKNLNQHYAVEQRIGNTRVLIVQPDLTPEELDKNLARVSDVCTQIMRNHGHNVECTVKKRVGVAEAV
jgi:hypothetical protein